jgi:hypothetical protein
MYAMRDAPCAMRFSGQGEKNEKAEQNKPVESHAEKKER